MAAGGEAFGIKGQVDAEMARITALARKYSDMAEARANMIQRQGNVMNVEQAAAMATMYQTAVMMLQNAVTMMMVSKARPDTGAR